MTSTSVPAKRILLVEDEPTICRVCRATFTRQGFAVDTVDNGGLAVNVLEADQGYALILIDIRTPVMNGKELYAWILKNHPELAKRAIFTTGDVFGGNSEAFISASGRVFLPKPFTPADLKAAISEALERAEE